MISANIKILQGAEVIFEGVMSGEGSPSGLELLAAARSVRGFTLSLSNLRDTEGLKAVGPASASDMIRLDLLRYFSDLLLMKAGESRRAYLVRVIYKINSSTDVEWARLSDATKEWFSSNVDRLNEGKVNPLRDFDGTILPLPKKGPKNRAESKEVVPDVAEPLTASPEAQQTSLGPPTEDPVQKSAPQALPPASEGD